jgi:outer membrane biosynthesis protein TonB
MICLMIVVLWASSASVTTADSLHFQSTIIVDGGGQDTIEDAFSQAQPGDVILVKAGKYDNGDPLEPLTVTSSGTAAAPITLLGENRPRLGTVKFSRANHIIIEGFEIAHQTSDRFFLGLDVVNSNNITIRDMLIHHLTGSAVSAGGDSSDIILEDSELYEITPRRSGDDAHCFVNSSARNITFRNNECFGFIGDGFHAWQQNDAVLYDRGVTLIEGNRIFNTKGPCSENGLDIKAEAGTVIIRKNVFFGFQELQANQCAIVPSGCGACQVINLQNGGTGDALIENNEIFDSDNVLYNAKMNLTMQNNIIHDISGYVIHDTTSSTKLFHNTIANVGRILHRNSTMPQEVVNNLFHNSGTAVGGFDHNGWFETDQQQPGPSDVTGSDPHLNTDYSLTSASPIIDRATDLGIDTDFTNIPGMRPHGAAPDIGAFEFTGASSEPTPEPTDEPTDEPTPEPTNEPAPASLALALSGPAAVDPGETFAMNVEAHNVTGEGIYGTQLEVNYDPTLISVSNLQVNADLSFVLRSTIDNTNGKIRLVASREGRMPGLTGDVTLLTFDVTAGDASATTDLTIENQKVSDAHAQSVETSTEDHTLSIGDVTPEPTDEPTPEPTDEPTPEPTDEPTPEPTDEPTPEPTDEPAPEPTDEPTPEPTGEPTMADVAGQVIVAGRANNNWSGASVTVEYDGQIGGQETSTTDAAGAFWFDDMQTDVQATITADAPGYLPAECAMPSFVAPETTLLPVTLLSGDIVEDENVIVDITDAVAVGNSFDESGSDLPADINRDGVVDIFDLVLVSINFGETGPQEWVCQ